MSHPLHFPLKKKQKQNKTKKTKTKTKKQATSDLQDNLYRIIAVAQVEATQKFISPQHLKIERQRCIQFYQLSNQVNWELNNGMGTS